MSISHWRAIKWCLNILFTKNNILVYKNSMRDYYSVLESEKTTFLWPQILTITFFNLSIHLHMFYKSGKGYELYWRCPEVWWYPDSLWFGVTLFVDLAAGIGLPEIYSNYVMGNALFQLCTWLVGGSLKTNNCPKLKCGINVH